MAITSISEPKKGQNFNFPQFYSKNDPEKPHAWCGVFFTFQCFVFFLIFALSCLSFSSFPLLLDFLKPQSGPCCDNWVHQIPIISLMQLHLPHFLWDSLQYAVAAFENLEIICCMQLQLLSFSESTSQKFLGGWV